MVVNHLHVALAFVKHRHADTRKQIAKVLNFSRDDAACISRKKCSWKSWRLHVDSARRMRWFWATNKSAALTKRTGSHSKWNHVPSSRIEIPDKFHWPRLGTLSPQSDQKLGRSTRANQVWQRPKGFAFATPFILASPPNEKQTFLFYRQKLFPKR